MSVGADEVRREGTSDGHGLPSANRIALRDACRVAIAHQIGFKSSAGVAQCGANDLFHLAGVKIYTGTKACHWRLVVTP